MAGTIQQEEVILNVQYSVPCQETGQADSLIKHGSVKQCLKHEYVSFM